MKTDIFNIVNSYKRLDQNLFFVILVTTHPLLTAFRFVAATFIGLLPPYVKNIFAAVTDVLRHMYPPFDCIL
jgi:hypothetical protein